MCFLSFEIRNAHHSSKIQKGPRGWRIAEVVMMDGFNAEVPLRAAEIDGRPGRAERSRKKLWPPEGCLLHKR